MSQWKPDLGEFLYKHPQLKNSLLNQTLVLTNEPWIWRTETELETIFFLPFPADEDVVFRKELEGFEVDSTIPFPLASERQPNYYNFTLRFSLETDFEQLLVSLACDLLSFQLTGICKKSSKSLLKKNYRPLSATWIDPQSKCGQLVPKRSLTMTESNSYWFIK